MSMDAQCIASAPNLADEIKGVADAMERILKQLRLQYEAGGLGTRQQLASILHRDTGRILVSGTTMMTTMLQSGALPELPEQLMFDKPEQKTRGPLTITGSGFEYRGIERRLSGRAHGVLRELVRGKEGIATLTNLRLKVWSKYKVSKGTVRSAICTARCGLKDAMDEAGDHDAGDPIIALSRGTKDLSWQLVLPRVEE